MKGNKDSATDRLEPNVSVCVCVCEGVCVCVCVCVLIIQSSTT